MKAKVRLRFTAGFLVLCLTAALAACGGKPSGEAANSTGTNSPSPATTADNKTKPPIAKINVAYMPDVNGVPPIVLGEEKGYFKEYGLEVNAVKFLSGPPEFQAMAARDIDIAVIGPGATFLAAQGQGKIIALTSLGFGDRVLATKKSGIKAFKDLKGKTVGTPKGTSGEMILNLGLEKAGLSPSDVNVVNMDVAGAVSAFVANKVDAVAIWSPYTDEIEKQVGKDNFVEVGGSKSFYPDYVFPGAWVVQPKFLEEKRDVVERFFKAWVKANDYHIKNLDESVKLVAKYTQVPEDSLRSQLANMEWIDSAKQAAQFQDGTIIKWYDHLVELFVKNEKMTKAVPASEFIDTELFPKIVKELEAEAK
ncbi:aliphatic sulfonate ABC transporter substrate-binding protein [Paenibacillus cymbidii]|uniref:aliphatic sulfonate ABC transporter substrate-binding protein n=1 Tax=Paenibacillus cymbidii TaxID=1639034 RepID=UPI001436AA0B|nr:aliphatic sulfonate ABC transporter substrate-binding protein [Paenibacillus cymbidii]